MEIDCNLIILSLRHLEFYPHQMESLTVTWFVADKDIEVDYADQHTLIAKLETKNLCNSGGPIHGPEDVRKSLPAYTGIG